MSIIKTEGTIVILREVALTYSLKLQEFALLDIGAEIRDGKLPKNKHEIYYRIQFEASASNQILVDYNCCGLEPLEPVIKFFLDKRLYETYDL